MSDEADGYHSAHYVKTSEDAAAVGINAGLDQEGMYLTCRVVHFIGCVALNIVWCSHIVLCSCTIGINRRLYTSRSCRAIRYLQKKKKLVVFKEDGT